MAVEIIILLLAFAAALFLLICAYFFRFACERGGGGGNLSGSDWDKYADVFADGKDWLDSKPTETVEITSFDGLRLSARLIPFPGSHRTVLMMHGYRSSGEFDFAAVAKYYYSLGCNMLIPDQRACGRSEGRYITFGVNESRDCVSWAQYLYERYGQFSDLFLHGVSMGASTVLMAAAYKLPPVTRGIIADCGFTSPRAILTYVLKSRFHLGAFPLMPCMKLICRLCAHFDIDGCDTRAILKQCRLPVVLVHGEADNFVPASMSRENYAACTGLKQLVTVADAGHAESYLVQPQRLQEMLRRFVQEYAQNR